MGTWAMEGAIHALPALNVLFKETLPTDVIPRRCAACWMRDGTACTTCMYAACVMVPCVPHATASLVPARATCCALARTGGPLVAHDARPTAPCNAAPCLRNSRAIRT